MTRGEDTPPPRPSRGGDGPRAPRGDAPAEPPTRLERWAAHPLGPAILFLSAVVEGVVFPAPTEALLAALALARPRRSAWLVAVATAGSVVGGVAAYAVGALFFDPVGRDLLARRGLAEGFASLRAAYRDHLALALVTSGYTPVPYLLYGLTAGAAGIPLGPFVLFSLVGRGLKFALLGVVTRWLGPPLRRLFRRRPGRLALAVAAVAALLAAWGWWMRG